MSKTTGRGSNAVEGLQGWQKVTPKPVKVPTARTVNSVDETTSKIEIVSPDILKSYELYKNRIQQKGRAQILSEAEYFGAFLEYGVEESLSNKAAKILSVNPPLLLATSGKMASGKDTITKALILKLSEKNHSHVSLSTAMKEETQEALDRIRLSEDRNAAMEELLQYNITEDQAIKVMNLVYDFAKAEPHITTRDRTPWIRSLLQYWATDIRRAQDKNYWTNRTISNVAEIIASEEDIIITDIRVADEVERFQSIGFTIIRLDIDPQIQAQRLKGRDGLEIDPKAVSHPNEMALDNFDGFNIRIDNNDVSVDELVENIFKLYNS